MLPEENASKPEWWPENPYVESALSIKSDADYAKAIPERELASEYIFKAMKENG